MFLPKIPFILAAVFVISTLGTAASIRYFDYKDRKACQAKGGVYAYEVCLSKKALR